MPIYKGTYYSRTFAFTDEAGAPVPITGWEFRSMWRAAKDAPNPPLLELTTANGGFDVVNGPGGLLLMQLLPADTDELPPAKVYFDVLRTDDANGPIWLFEGSVPVKVPITHD